MSEESKKIDVMVDSEGTVVSSLKKDKKKKTKSRESTDSEREKLSEGGSVVKKKSKKKKRVGSDSLSKAEESEKTSNEVDSVKKVKQSKKKKRSGSVFESEKTSDEVMVDSESIDVVKKTKKKSKEKSVDSVSVSEDSVEKSNVDSVLDDAKKKKKKKMVKRKLDDTDLVAEEETIEKESKKKKKKVKPSVDNALDAEVEDNANDAKKKKKLSENAEAEENNEEGTTKDAEKKKRKKKKEKVSNDEDVVTTPSSSSKSNKKVKFSDQVEVFPSNEDKDSDNEEDSDSDKEIEMVRGKRFTKEEDALVKQAVLDYIANHALGENGLDMVMNCKKHPEIKGCWQEIESALPWRAKSSVYYRAHNLFEEGSKGVWTPEDLELVKQFQAKHGNDWKTIADGMGKHRIHVKDAWRRIRLNMNKGRWSREEYQTLFDLVNTDIKMKAYKEKHSKHGMLRDNIPWMAISDKLGTQGHVHCCEKWYNQLTSPMVKSGIWANVDDYRLLQELMKLDAACIDDVEWDELLENRDGYACRKRWNQMVLHIGSPGSKTFAEQVDILSQRYCPDLAEEVENYENRPFDPED